MKTPTIIMLCCLLWIAGSAQGQQGTYLTDRVAGTSGSGTVTKDRNSKMSARLDGIYISGDVLYFHVFLRNRSHIAFDIDFVRFYIRDRRTAKRTVTQEQEIPPLDMAGLERPRVEGHCGKTLVAALDKFTLSDGKILAIEVYERGGGRHLYLNVRNRHIERAKPIQ